MLWFNHLTFPWNISKNAQFLTPSYMDQDMINDKFIPVIFIPFNELPLCFMLVFIRQWLQPNIKKKMIKIDLTMSNIINSNRLPCNPQPNEQLFNMWRPLSQTLAQSLHWATRCIGRHSTLNNSQLWSILFGIPLEKYQ